MAKKNRISARVSAQETTGFGPNDVDVEIVDAYWGQWQEAGERSLVNGREADDPALVLTFQGEDGSEYAPVFLGAGKAAKIQPSEDGDEPGDKGPYIAAPEGSTAKGVHKSSKSAKFIASLTAPKKGKLKFDDKLLDPPNGGVANLIGMKLHVVEVPTPGQPAPEEGQRARTDLLCESISQLGSGKVKGGKVAKKSAKPADDDEDDDDADETPKKKVAKADDDGGDDEDGDVSSEAEAAVVKILAKNSGSVKVTDIVKKGFSIIKGENKMAIIDMIQDDDWIQDDDRPWEFDEKKGVIKAVEEEEEE